MEQKEQLNSHEWVVVISLIFFMGTLTWVTHAHWMVGSKFHGEPIHVYANQVHIRVEGAVEAPGEYQVKKGSTIQDVLNQAKLHPEASVDKISLSKKVRDGQIIRVPAKKSKSPRRKRTNRTQDQDSQDKQDVQD